MKNEMLYKLYSEKVAEYLNKGYVINPETMHSCEWGSVDDRHISIKAKVDFIDGKDYLIRVAIVDSDIYGDYEKGTPDKRTMNVEVMRAKTNSRKDRFNLDNCEILYCYEFYEIASGYYGTKEEADHAKTIRREHRNNMYEREKGYWSARGCKDFTTPLAKAYVLPFVQKQKGFKRATLKDIDSIRKDVRCDWKKGRLCKTEVTYTIYAKGKSLILADNRTYHEAAR